MKLSKDLIHRTIANKILQGKCPFGYLDGENPKGVLFCCELGIPGCACADELVTNPYLAVLRAEYSRRSLEDETNDPNTNDRI